MSEHLTPGQKIIYSACMLSFYDYAPYTPYTGPKNWPGHMWALAVNMRALFGLPIVVSVHCPVEGCDKASVYDEPGWKCHEHQSISFR